MKLRRERFVSTFLDPRQGFASVRIPVEVRWDPITGQSSRLLPAGSIPPPVQQNLEVLAEQSRADCPFCSEAIDHETPMFHPKLWAAGRIQCGEAVLFPNLIPYSKWSAVSVYSPQRHLLPISDITPQLLADNLMTQVTFGRAVIEHDPASSWISVNANQLPPSGSSIFHPHLQGSANPVPSTMQRLLTESPRAVAEYVRIERESERHIASEEDFVWLASFAPMGPAEIRGFVSGMASPTQLDESTLATCSRGIAAALRAYSTLGYQSFNLAVYGAPRTTPGYSLSIRIVARAYLGPLLRSDAMWSERLHLEAATDMSPERTAAVARAEFDRPAE